MGHYYSAPKTRVIDVLFPVIYGDALKIENYLVCQTLADGVTDLFGCAFSCPNNFVSGASVYGLVRCDGGGNIVSNTRANYSKADEVYSTHQVSVTDVVTACDVIRRELIAPVSLPDLAIGDYVAVSIERQGGHASDTIGNEVLGLGCVLRYTGYYM